eukprot:433971_1
MTYTGIACVLQFLIRRKLRIQDDQIKIKLPWYIPAFIIVFTLSFFIKDLAEEIFDQRFKVWEGISIAIGNMWGPSWCGIYAFTIHGINQSRNNEDSTTINSDSRTNNVHHSSDKTWSHLNSTEQDVEMVEKL